MIDARRANDADAAATAERVGQRLESLYWQKLPWRDGMSREMLGARNDAHLVWLAISSCLVDIADASFDVDHAQGAAVRNVMSR